MAVHAGPDIVNDGLVLCLDAANSNDPTVNLVTSPNSINIAKSSGTITTDNAIDLPNSIAKKSPATDKADLVTGGVWIAHTVTTVSNNTQYMCSWVIKAFSGVTTITWNWGGSHQGNKSTFDISLVTGQISNLNIISGERYVIEILEDGWFRIGCTTTMTSGGGCYPQINYNGSVGGIYLCGCQFEEGPELTPFTIGQRGWKNLVNSSNFVNLNNNPGQTSNFGGGIVFDGTNDSAFPSVSHSYLSPSTIEFIFRSTSHGSGLKTIGGYRHNGGFSLPTIGSMYLNGNTLSASVITTSQVYRTATFPTTIQTNTTYHAVLNKDTTNGTLQLFVNGIAGSAQTFDAATYAQWPSVGSFIGANSLDIGKSTNNTTGQGWGSDFFQGIIFGIRLYNRALTAQEIQQNFNATRGRFGI
jgi:hypothetical protein